MEQARFGNREQWNDSYLGGGIYVFILMKKLCDL